MCLLEVRLVLCVQVEYDLRGSGVDDLQLMSVDRIEQSAVPLAMAWYPPLTKESFILLSSDQVSRTMTTTMCVCGAIWYMAIIMSPVQAEAVQLHHQDVQEDSTGTHLRQSPHKVRTLSPREREREIVLPTDLSSRLVVLPAPIIRSEAGEEKRRYLAYITTDKVQ